MNDDAMNARIIQSRPPENKIANRAGFGVDEEIGGGGIEKTLRFTEFVSSFCKPVKAFTCSGVGFVGKLFSSIIGGRSMSKGGVVLMTTIGDFKYSLLFHSIKVISIHEGKDPSLSLNSPVQGTSFQNSSFWWPSETEER